jgi:hypothetical protein
MLSESLWFLNPSAAEARFKERRAQGRAFPLLLCMHDPLTVLLQGPGSRQFTGSDTVIRKFF